MITIVTVSYNNVSGLRATSRSIECQKGATFDWVVIDGGSADGTAEFVASHPLVTRFVSERDEGIYDAMRKGLGLCATDFVLFLNAGDVLHEDTSLQQVQRALDDRDVFFFDTIIEAGSRRWYRKARSLSAAKYSVPAVQQSTVYKVAKLRKLTWPTKYKICGDFCIAAQLLATGATDGVFHFNLSRFQIGGVSTESFVRLCQEAAEIQRDVLGTPVWRRAADFCRRFLAGSAVLFMHRVAQISGAR